MPAVTITFEQSAHTERLLSQLAYEVREKALDQAQRVAARIVQRQAERDAPHDPKPDGKPHLASEIKIVTRRYQSITVTVVGPAWPAAAHGHLVEFGHAHYAHKKPTGHTVPGYPFLEPAAVLTQQQQAAAIIASLQRAVDRAAKTNPATK